MPLYEFDLSDSIDESLKSTFKSMIMERRGDLKQNEELKKSENKGKEAEETKASSDIFDVFQLD